jgi:hypothetical protein
MLKDLELKATVIKARFDQRISAGIWNLNIGNFFEITPFTFFAMLQDLELKATVIKARFDRRIELII